MKNNRFLKAQSVIEYLLFISAVILVLLGFLAPNGPFHKSIEGVMNQSVNQIEDMGNNYNFDKALQNFKGY